MLCLFIDPGRLDFSPDPIKVSFPVGRTRTMVVDVPIIDDDINEALEYFIVELSFADPASVPSTVSIGSSVMRCDIVDNDGECSYIAMMCYVHIIIMLKIVSWLQLFSLGFNNLIQPTLRWIEHILSLLLKELAMSLSKQSLLLLLCMREFLLALGLIWLHSLMETMTMTLPLDLGVNFRLNSFHLMLMNQLFKS